MDDTGPLTLLMNFVGPILIGALLFYGVYATWRRRQNPRAEQQTETATRELYDKVEEDRRRRQG
jgi:hypothetical protein